jgi:hypothetical protein
VGCKRKFCFSNLAVIIYDNLKCKGAPMDWEIEFYGNVDEELAKMPPKCG